MVQLTTKELELLKLVAEYRLLIASQIALLTGTGLRAAQKKMKSLFTRGYFNISQHNMGSMQGRPENVYSLNQRGAELLRNCRCIDSEVSPNRITAEEIINIGHELLTNWFRLHLLQIERHVPDLDTEFLSATTPYLPPTGAGMPFIADKIRANEEDEWFIPDGVFSIASIEQNKRLLFFLEVDMSTEPIRSAHRSTVTIARKVRNYKAFFVNSGYKRYEKQWPGAFNGFRVLFLTNTPHRNETISHYLRADHPSCDFIWIADAHRMFRRGLSAKIWARGGKSAPRLESILGPTLSGQLPLPKLS